MVMSHQHRGSIPSPSQPPSLPVPRDAPTRTTSSPAPGRRASVFSAAAGGLASPPPIGPGAAASPPPPPPSYLVPPPIGVEARPFTAGHRPSQPRRRSFFPDYTNLIAPVHTQQRLVPEVDFEKQKEIQQRLERVLTDPGNFARSAAQSFAQFDRDRNGRLDFLEVQALVFRLVSNLQLPRLDDALLYKFFKRYDLDQQASLDLTQFQSMYWKLLGLIKEKFFPTHKMKVRRSTFVGERYIRDPGGIRRYFKFVRRLGAGSFGEVFLVLERSSGFPRVCKIINKDLSKIPMEQIDAEIQVLKRLDHPHIIKVFEVYQDYNSMYIIMEVCDGGELADRISKTFDTGYILTERYVAEIMRQLLEAVNYFHTQKVAHKDLKPENILFQSAAPDSPIKVIDFGLAEIFERLEDLSEVAAGTYLYMAPEVLDYIVTLKCDIWSAGCIMFQLLTGEVPFPGATIEAVEYKLRHDDPPFSKLSSLPISRSAVDLLQRMLNKDYRTRISAHECLAHPWLAAGRESSIHLPREICDNLKKYRKQSNLKNVLTNMLAHQLNVTGTQIRRITDIFRSLDKDGNGYLSKRELGDGPTL